jgi:hypothetical protein
MAKKKVDSQNPQVQTQAPQVQANDLQVPRFDFSMGLDALANQLDNFNAFRKSHVIRSYLKFKKVPAYKYEVECLLGRELPSLIVKYFYDGSTYNYVLSYRHGRTISRELVVMDTRTVPEEVAKLIYNATLSLLEYLQSDGSFRLLVELRRKGYIVRRRIDRLEDQNAPEFKEFLKIFQQ